jgi:hypothetical protein
VAPTEILSHALASARRMGADFYQAQRSICGRRSFCLNAITGRGSIAVLLALSRLVRGDTARGVRRGSRSCLEAAARCAVVRAGRRLPHLVRGSAESLLASPPNDLDCFAQAGCIDLELGKGESHQVLRPLLHQGE